MTITAVIYLIVKFVEITVITLSGIAISRLPKNMPSKCYWQIAIWAIMAYACGEGLRWGHMNDYNYLCQDYYSISGFFELTRNPLWSTIIYTCRIIGIRYNFFIFLQCGFLFYSIMLLVRKYSKYAAYILPLAVIGILGNENYIRWFTAFSFLLIGLYFFINNKNVKAYIFIFMAVMIHFGYMFIFIIFLLFKPLNRLNLNSYILCGLVVFSILFADITFFSDSISELSTFLISMGLTEDVNDGFGYLGIAGSVVGGEYESGITTSSVYAKIIKIATHVPVILFAKKIVPQNVQYYNSFYNIYAVGILLGQFLFQVELLSRYAILFVFFFCVVGGIFYKSLLQEKKHLVYQLIVIVGILSYFIPYVKAPFVRDDVDMYFLWDSEGQEMNRKVMTIG